MANRRPWWQNAKTARQGFWMGVVLVVVGLAWIALTLSRAIAWSPVGGVVPLVMGASYLISAAVLHRRLRPSAGSDGQPEPSSTTPPPSS